MELVVLELVAPYLLGILVFMAASLLVHEYGHFAVASKRGFEPKWFGSWKPLRVGILTNSNETPKDRVDILRAGILLGLVPVVLSFVFLNWFGLIVLLGYVWGCVGDLKTIKAINRLN